VREPSNARRPDLSILEAAKPEPAPAAQPAVAPPASKPRPRTTVSTTGIALIGVVVFGLAGAGAVLLTGGHGPVATQSGGAGPAGPATQGDAKTVFLASVGRTNSASMRADLSMSEYFTLNAPNGADLGETPGSLTFTIHIDQQTAQRSELHETLTAPGLSKTYIVVLYDGGVFLSSNSGASYQTVSVDQVAPHQLSPQSALQYLSMVGNVTHTGEAELNSVPVQQYHADLDPVKVTNYVRSALALDANDSFTTKVLNNMGVTDGSVDASLDASGNLVSENGAIDCAIDLGVFSAAAKGATLSVKLSFSGWFNDYGSSSISISKPGQVAGAAHLT